MRCALLTCWCSQAVDSFLCCRYASCIYFLRFVLSFFLSFFFMYKSDGIGLVVLYGINSAANAMASCEW